ncbi:Hypothetical predicted protein [Octopus vulgaris]|uniref:MULE transposase domain-containing protein n=1 Tax=Octopus vulgaris TaxID=6645 RepID=A0AA36FB53_OCTVU|nr:Hypothetical predicted protein [Octopus vulgaris]
MKYDNNDTHVNYGAKTLTEWSQDEQMYITISISLPTVEDAEDAYGELIDNEEIPAEFITYFNLIYIGIVRRRSARRRREPSTFPIAEWNVNQCILQDLPRRNNAVEKFHSVIKYLVGEAQLNIWKLIKTLKEEEGFI